MKKNKIYALLTSYEIIVRASDPLWKEGLSEIENNYTNLNYSDWIVLILLLRDMSSIREREIATEISSWNNSNHIKFLMPIPKINFYIAAGIVSEIGTVDISLNKEIFASYTG